MIKLVIIIGVISFASEILLQFTNGVFRRLLAYITLNCIAFSSVGLVVAYPNLATILLGTVSMYRSVNMLRIIETRMNPGYLRHATRQSSLWFIAMQGILLGLWYMYARIPLVTTHILMSGLVCLQIIVAVLLFASLLRHMRTTKLLKLEIPFADRDLPTVTVAIPARNEDEQLESCLRSILASDYPKLEVIVLDDCSQDKTPDIIRGFAHDGVRFVSGEDPQPTWLAKNQAYNRLTEEASGDIIVFCGVDIRMEPETMRTLITGMLQKKKRMMSIMPHNEQYSPSSAQIMRYFWELALPRRMFNRPPVLSSCWLIYRSDLARLGGFAAVSRSISPEAFFARSLIRSDGYSFLRSNTNLSLASRKTGAEQYNTAIRTRYPQLHRRPEMVCLFSLAALAFLLAPFVLMVIGFWGWFSALFEFGWIFTAALLVILYRVLEFAAFPRNPWIILSFFPYVVAADLVRLHISMWKYEFSEVIWKGRNICLPTMHVIPHLPKM